MEGKFAIYGIKGKVGEEFKIIDRRKKSSRGKFCMSYLFDELVDIMYSLGVKLNKSSRYPNRVQMINSMNKSLKRSLVDYNSFSDNKLKYFYDVITLGLKKKEICDMIEKYLEEHNMITEGVMGNEQENILKYKLNVKYVYKNAPYDEIKKLALEDIGLQGDITVNVTVSDEKDGIFTVEYSVTYTSNKKETGKLETTNKLTEEVLKYVSDTFKDYESNIMDIDIQHKTKWVMTSEI